MSARIGGIRGGALDELADRLAGEMKVASDLADGLTVDEITTTDLA